MYKQLLSLKMGVVGVLPKTFVYRLGDFFTHFPCRRIGKGKDKKLIYVAGVSFSGNKLNYPLHKNSRLARPCRRRKQNVLAAGIYRLFLFFCPFHEKLTTLC
jgi:hypothetical protein